jgi:hypothetical protein
MSAENIESVEWAKNLLELFENYSEAEIEKAARKKLASLKTNDSSHPKVIYLYSTTY